MRNHTSTSTSTGTLRTRPVPEGEVAGPSTALTGPRGRMAPMEMQQIALQPLTDPDSHFRLRSVALQRPRANFDAFEEGSSHGNTGGPEQAHRSGSLGMDALNSIHSVLGRLSRGSRGRKESHSSHHGHHQQTGAPPVMRAE